MITITPTKAAFDAALHAFIVGLAHIETPDVDVTPEPEQIEAIADLVVKVAHLGDAFMRAVGEELRANAPTVVDLKCFQTPFFDAVDGYALFAIACVAEDLRNEYEDAEA